jgi:hypothetical protein
LLFITDRVIVQQSIESTSIDSQLQVITNNRIIYVYSTLINHPLTITYLQSKHHKPVCTIDLINKCSESKNSYHLIF